VHHGERPVKATALAETVRTLLDPQRRGRQFMAARLVQLAGTRAAGFVLTRQEPAGKLGAATYPPGPQVIETATSGTAPGSSFARSATTHRPTATGALRVPYQGRKGRKKDGVVRCDGRGGRAAVMLTVKLSMISMPRLGLPTCSPGSPITTSTVLISCCPGIGIHSLPDWRHDESDQAERRLRQSVAMPTPCDPAQGCC
jgi:hypothetical protein